MRQPEFASRCASLTAIAVLSLILARSAFAANFVYEQNFDGLSLGQTQPFPGDAGQGGWSRQTAVGDAFGEIQSSVANTGRALHEFTATTNVTGQQTIDRRNLPTINLNALPLVTLGFDFYAHTSNLNSTNVYTARLTAEGGPHPGFQVLEAGLFAGNGPAKGVSGVSVSMYAFNGANNNDSMPLVVGQHLAFDAWHRVSISIDQGHDRFIAITVDGNTQGLSAFTLPRSFDGTQWLRGQLIEYMTAQVIPDNSTPTADDIYWDNLSLTAVPEPSSFALAGVGFAAAALLVRQRAARMSLSSRLAGARY